MSLSRADADLRNSSLLRTEREKNASSAADINADKQRSTIEHIMAIIKLMAIYQKESTSNLIKVLNLFISKKIKTVNQIQRFLRQVFQRWRHSHRHFCCLFFYL